MNYPTIAKIIETKNEANNVKTIKFECNKKTQPGQFFMIWIPKIDEIPMSVSYIDKKIKGITFRKIGDATKALYNLKKGDKIGIRGPYGNGFEINENKILFVGGGTGISTIVPAIEKAIIKNISATAILGVKNKDELFFKNRIKKTGAKLIVTTDDGSEGKKGFASDTAEHLLKNEKFDLILTCGPEIMMKKILDISSNIPFQASLERYMKCGIGLCGQCCVGEGLRVCVDGPVFDKKVLKNVKDFGIYKRDAAGRKIKF
jgi:dihydroorotate dehydrogenase electron transfer subunit